MTEPTKQSWVERNCVVDDYGDRYFTVSDVQRLADSHKELREEIKGLAYMVDEKGSPKLPSWEVEFLKNLLTQSEEFL